MGGTGVGTGVQPFCLESLGLYGSAADGYGFVKGVWERPEDAPAEWRYDKAGVHEAVVQAMDVDHPTAMLAVDPTWFEDYVFGWQGVAADGRTVTFPGWINRWPGRVVLDVQKYGSQAWAQFRRGVLDGGFSHDGDPRLVRHMRNAREVTRTRDGRSYTV